MEFLGQNRRSTSWPCRRRRLHTWWQVSLFTFLTNVIELAPVGQDRCRESGQHFSLLSGEEVIVRRVVDASRRPGRGLRTTSLRRPATHGIHSLYARDLAERAFRTDGLSGKQPPRDGVGHWRVGTLLHRTQDLAAIAGFPMWAGILSAGPVSPRVNEMRFGRQRRP